MGEIQTNLSDTVLTKFIQERIIEKKYQFILNDEFDNAKYLGQPFFTRRFNIGHSIYETNMYCDFVIYHPEKWPKCLIIESKWQVSSGSVDEKFPYFALNIKERYPYKTIVLLDGEGYKRNAATWLKNQIDDKLLHVFSMTEFEKWSKKGNI